MPENESIYQREKKELTLLWAVTSSLITIREPGLQGPFLVNYFTAYPRMMTYFRAAYDAALQYKFRPRDVAGRTALMYESRIESRLTLLQALKRANASTPEHFSPALWLEMLIGLGQPEFIELANRILNKSLDCGLSHSTLNKVLIKVHGQGITLPNPCPAPIAREIANIGPVVPLPDGVTSAAVYNGVSIEIRSDVTAPCDYLTGKFMHRGYAIGEVSFHKTDWRVASAVLRAAGIAITAAEKGHYEPSFSSEAPF